MRERKTMMSLKHVSLSASATARMLMKMVQERDSIVALFGKHGVSDSSQSEVEQASDKRLPIKHKSHLKSDSSIGEACAWK